MTDRGLSAGTITALESQELEFYYLVRFDFATPLYYSTGSIDIIVDGNNYLSNHILNKIPDFSESLKIKPGGMSLSVAGSDINTHALPLTNDYKGADVYIYKYIPATGAFPIMYKGIVDSFSSDEDIASGKSVLKWNIKSHFADFDSKNGRLINDKNQQELYPGDLGFEFVGRTDRVIDYWGEKSFISPTEGVTQARDWISNNQEYYDAWISNIYPDANRLGTYFDNGAYDWQPNTTGSANSLPVVYGETIIKGTPIFRDVTGADGEFLWVVYALAEGECDSLQETRFDQGLASGLTPHVTLTFYNGSTTQSVGSVSGLTAASGDWTASHRCRGVCCVVAKYEIGVGTTSSGTDENSEVWQGEPNPGFTIRGKKCVPIGGGSAVFTKDPVTILQDYLTDSLYGKGLSTSDLDNFSTSSSYVYGTKTEHDGGAGTIKRFEFNGVIETRESIKKNVESILFNMVGHLPWISGLYKLVIERDDETTPTYTFTGDHFKKKFKVIDKSLNLRANAVYYTFTNPLINYADSTEFTQLSTATINAEDAGKKLRINVKNKYEVSKYRAKNHSNRILKSSRDGIGCEFTAINGDAIRVETGDVIAVTRASQGWVGKLFRVVSMTLMVNGRTKFQCIEYDNTNYDWTVNAETPDETTTTLTDPLNVSAPTTLTVASGTTHQIIRPDGTTINRLLVTIGYATDDANIKKYEIEYKETADTSSEYTKFTELVGYLNKTCYISGVSYDATYNVRARAVNSLGVKSPWTTALNHLVGGEAIVGYDQQVWGTNAYSNVNYYVRYLFETLTAFIKVNATLSTSLGVYLQSNGVLQSRIYKYQLRSPVTLSWDKNRRLKCKILIDVYTGLVSGDAHFVFIGNSLTGYVGLKIEYNGTDFTLKCISYDGTTVSTGASFGNVAAGVEFTVEVLYEAGVDFTVNTDDGATQNQGTKSTNIPSDSKVSERRLPFEVLFTHLKTAPRMYVNDVTFLQEA